MRLIYTILVDLQRAGCVLKNVRCISVVRINSYLILFDDFKRRCGFPSFSFGFIAVLILAVGAFQHYTLRRD